MEIKTNNSLQKQLENEKDCLKFIKLWFKGVWLSTTTTWIISILLLTKFHIDFFIIPSILLTGGITLSSLYMLTQSSKLKHNIKKLEHKIHIEEMNLFLNKTTTQNQNKQKNNTNIKKNNYNHNNIYNYLKINNQTNKNYKIKKRVLKKNKEYKSK